MRPLLDHPPVLEDDDQVRVADRREPVRDHEGGAPGEEPPERLLDLALGADVDRGGRLVEDQDPGVGQERAREGDELTLAEREPCPALAELRLVAVLELEDETVGADRLRGRRDLLRCRVRSRERDVLGDGAAEEESLLGDDPELTAERVLRDVAEIVAVDLDPALRRVVEAGEELRDRRLAGAGLADERDRRARRDVEVEPVQHLRELRPVAEADTLEADVAVDPRQLDRVLRVHDLWLLVEHADDLVERGDRGQERVVELRELLDRVEEVAEIEREGEERACAHVAVVDEPAAVAEDDRGCRRREQVDRREVDRVQDGRLVVRVAIAAVDAVERALLDRFARERLDDAHPRDVLRQRRGHEPEPLADVAVGAVRAAPEPRRDKRHRRQHGERRQREPPVEQEEDDGGAEEQERVLDEARDAVGDELVERLDVVRDPADDGAGAIALVEAHREPLEVAEELVPEVGEHSLARPAGQVRVRGGKEERGHRRGQEEDDDPGEPVEVRVVDPLVDRELREVGRRERDHGVGEQRRECERRAAAVGQRQPREQADALSRSPPRPVLYRAALLLGEMPARLPDLHAVSFRRPWMRPCS